MAREGGRPLLGSDLSWPSDLVAPSESPTYGELLERPGLGGLWEPEPQGRPSSSAAGWLGTAFPPGMRPLISKVEKLGAVLTFLPGCPQTRPGPRPSSLSPNPRPASGGAPLGRRARLRDAASRAPSVVWAASQVHHSLGRRSQRPPQPGASPPLGGLGRGQDSNYLHRERPLTAYWPELVTRPSPGPVFPSQAPERGLGNEIR